MIHNVIRSQDHLNHDLAIWNFMPYCYTYRGTPIGTIIDTAIQSNNPDTQFLGDTDMDAIPSNVSHFMDLTKDRTKFTLIEQPFTDDIPTIQSLSDRLLIFTDGSVQDKAGGFGIHMIDSNQYVSTFDYVEQTCSTDPNIVMLQNSLTNGTCQSHQQQTSTEKTILQMKMQIYQHHTVQQQKSVNVNLYKDLSTRCSIDFCESRAIRDALQRFHRIQPNNRCQHYNHIHIISDSLTVLKWISGEFKIKSMPMKSITEEIHWIKNMIEDKGIQVSFQWVKSHNNTLGNEMADILANKGRLMTTKTTQNKLIKPNIWKYYHMRAAVNECVAHFRSLNCKELWNKMKKTQFATIMKQKTNDIGLENLKWNNSNKELIPFLSRNDVRTLIGIKAGKVGLNNYNHTRFKRGESINCPFCHSSSDTVEHALSDDINNCKDLLIQQLRDDMRLTGEEVLTASYKLNGTDWAWKGWNFDLKPTDIMSLIFPDKRLDKITQSKLIKTITETVRKLIKLNQATKDEPSGIG